MNERIWTTTLDPDPVLWDDFVARHPYGHLLQTTRFARLRETHGWQVRRVALVAHGQIVAGGALHHRQLPWHRTRVGYLPRGPVIDLGDRPLALALRHALDREARHLGLSSLAWEPAVAADEIARQRLSLLGLRPGLPTQPRSTIVVDIGQPLDMVQAAQKPKWRYNTRLAARHGVRIVPATSVTDVAAWLGIMHLTAERDRFLLYDDSYYVDAWHALCQNEQGALLLAFHEDVLLAGILLALCGEEAIYLYGASADEQRHLMPNYLLQWEGMLWARQRGARRYDMWGIPDTDRPDEPLRGVERFKSGWGGHVVRYTGVWNRVYHPLRYTIVTDIVARGKKAWLRARRQS